MEIGGSLLIIFALYTFLQAFDLVSLAPSTSGALSFGGIFIITQMHGLGLARWVRWVLLGVYAAAVTGVYAVRGWGKLNEIIRIPVIDYPLVFILAGLIWLGMLIFRRRGPAAATTAANPDAKAA